MEASAAAASDVQTIREMNAKLKAKLKDVLQELQTARAGLEAADAAAVERGSTASELEASLAVARTEAATAIQERDTARAELEAAGAEAATAREQAMEISAVAVVEAETVKEMNGKLKAKLKDVLQELQAARSGLEADKAEVAELREEMTRQAAESDARLAEAAAQLSSETEARARLEADQRAAPCPGATLLLGTRRLCAYPALCSTSDPSSHLPSPHRSVLRARMLLSQGTGVRLPCLRGQTRTVTVCCLTVS